MADALIRFPEPQGGEVGSWTVGNGGEYNWSLPWAINAVQAACDYVLWQCGPGVCPLAVYDCADENGDTPAGRHPGGAHDVSPRMGVNMDLGYWLLANDGNPWAGSDNDGTHLTGPPDRLDVTRQAHFYAALAWQDLQAQEKVGISRLLRIAAMDGQIIGPVLDEMGTLGLAQATLDRAREILHGEVNDQGTGWYSYHGDHTHLRFEYYDGDTADQLAAFFQAREAYELDQIKGGDATKPTPGTPPPDPTQHPNGDPSEGHPPPPISPPSPGPAPPPLPNPSTETGGGDGNKAGPVPAEPKTPAPRIPEGARKLDPGGGWGQLSTGRAFWVPGTKNNPTPMPPLLLRAPGVTIVAEEPGGFYIDDGQPIRGEDAPCGLRAMNADRLRWDGGDLRDSPGRNVRLTDCADVQIANADSSGAGIEAWQFGNCPRLRMRNCRGRDAGRPHSSTSPDRQHALYGSGDMDGSEFDGFWGSDCPGSVQFNGGGFSDHVIRGLVARNFSLRNMGSGGTPAVSLMAVEGSTFENWLIEASRAGAVLFDDGRGPDYGVRNNTFRNWTFSDLEVWTIHLQVGGGNTWIGLKGAEVPDGDIDGGPGREAPPSPAPGPAGNTVTLAHGDPWPDLQPGMTVLLGDGDWRTLSFRGEKGTKDRPIIIRAQNPGKVRAAIEITEGNEWVTWDLR